MGTWKASWVAVRVGRAAPNAVGNIQISENATKARAQRFHIRDPASEKSLFTGKGAEYSTEGKDTQEFYLLE